jgi:hypothetical protein
VPGEVFYFFFQPHEVFFGIKKIVKPVDRGDGAFLMKFTHNMTSFSVSFD